MYVQESLFLPIAIAAFGLGHLGRDYISAPIDTEVTITGNNFNPIPEKNLVSFGATRAAVLSSSSTEVKVKVPPAPNVTWASLIITTSTSPWSAWI
jgi:hypothetical protein